jgi:UDP-2-acetamido-2-deoxy-ribo-hexuluronate aminotransferase
MGPEVRELESKLADYVGVKHALACSSGTDALILPLMTKGLTKSDAVFTTPFTFFASAESISLAGATPVFVDIDPDTYNIDPAALESKIQEVIAEGKLTPRGIMPVDLFGLAADYEPISTIAEKYDLFVLEDAAQSFGAPYNNRRAGGFGDVAGTSFYPAKPLGCYGDGGAVFTNDTAMYEEMVSLRVHGQAQSGDKYDNVRIGINGRMDTIQAAILLEKLKFYDHELAERNRVAQQYSGLLAQSVKTPTVPAHQGSVWAQYSIQVEDRAKLQADLSEKGIPTAVFYPIPIHLSTAYKYLGHMVGDFPVSEAVSKKIVSLPMHPYLDHDTVHTICDAVNESVET